MSVQEEFDSSGHYQVEVPEGLEEFYAECYGASGAGASEADGGEGGYCEATIPVTIEDGKLEVYVGGSGGNAGGGYNGGGDGGSDTYNGSGAAGGGGGATDIRVGGDSLDDRVIVAAGGGGGGLDDWDEHYKDGGDGGAETGQDGQGTSYLGSPNAGGGGDQDSGGDAGTGDRDDGEPGEFGVGGVGGEGGSMRNGGGGGAGWYGGGGGGVVDDGVTGRRGGGGGGGSNYVIGDATGVTSQRGGNTGDGYILIEYPEQPEKPTNLDAESAPGEITVTWTDPDDSFDQIEVHRGDNEDFAIDEPIGAVDAGVEEFVDEDVDTGETWYYKVIARSGPTPSEYDAVWATVPLPPPTNVEYENVTNESVDLSWELQTTNEDRVFIESSLDGGETWQEEVVLDPGTESHTLDGLKNGREYMIRIVAEVD